MINLYTVFNKKYNRYGAFGLVKVMLRKLVRRFYQRKEFFVLTKSLEWHSDQYLLPKSIRASRLEFGNIPLRKIDEIKFIDESRKGYLRKYLNEGAELYGLWVNEQIRSFNLVHTKRMLDLSKNIDEPLLDNQIYQFDGLVDPAFRGKALAQYHMDQLYRVYAAAGYKDSLCLVEKDNRASLRFHRRNQYVPIKVGITINFLGKGWLRWREWDAMLHPF